MAGAKTFSKFSFISEECNTIWFINIADQTGSTWENCTIYSTAFVVVRSRGYEYLMNIFFRNVCSIFFPGSSLFLVCFVIFIVKNINFFSLPKLDPRLHNIGWECKYFCQQKITYCYNSTSIRYTFWQNFNFQLFPNSLCLWASNPLINRFIVKSIG